MLPNSFILLRCIISKSFWRWVNRFPHQEHVISWKKKYLEKNTNGENEIFNAKYFLQYYGFRRHAPPSERRPPPAWAIRWVGGGITSEGFRSISRSPRVRTMTSPQSVSHVAPLSRPAFLPPSATKVGPVRDDSGLVSAPWRPAFAHAAFLPTRGDRRAVAPCGFCFTPLRKAAAATVASTVATH